LLCSYCTIKLKPGTKTNNLTIRFALTIYTAR
jgi:hypothetical protein